MATLSDEDRKSLQRMEFAVAQLEPIAALKWSRLTPEERRKVEHDARIFADRMQSEADPRYSR